ncbi:hypothetical protein [Nonomuraea zeae]|uniref:SET domain-containing protein n=1 Tax=Nonomuraea zeae TaxID=1642303 RepID=A0A5S4FZY0_9ACTN|nr:hypothetical protein [Nonomuraea zeae]TMR26283.1 hypothetical protein ETD85_43050 [Nonomuraea zeae]
MLLGQRPPGPALPPVSDAKTPEYRRARPARGGQLINDETLATLTPPYSSLTVEEGVHLLLDPAHPVRYGNHSCEPNLWHRDATTVIARTTSTPAMN